MPRCVCVCIFVILANARVARACYNLQFIAKIRCAAQDAPTRETTVTCMHMYVCV